jgi:reductive dehalogenase
VKLIFVIIIRLSWILAVSFSIFSFLFIIYSIKERELRAAFFGFILFGGISSSWIAFLIFSNHFSSIITILIFAVSLLFLFFIIAPLGSKKAIQIIGSQERVDERDVIFSRYYALKIGTAQYAKYYQNNPHLKKIDDKTRQLPSLGSPQTPTYHHLATPLFFAYESFIERISGLVDGPVAKVKKEVNAREMATVIKRMLKHMGADLAGITRLNQAYIYSVAGRIAERYGKIIELNHPYAIAFAVGMDYWMNKASPLLNTLLETDKQYLRAAWISIVLAEYIRSLGYLARAHIDANYQAILPPIAADAGLGELGRIGILITEKFGPRVRLGLVTTDLPLAIDKPITFGVQDFCRRCRKCADNCPAGAISKGEKVIERGVEKWVINRERCFQYWNSVGTDCGICIRVCPYSKPETSIHNIIRFFNKQSFIARQISLWGDDLFYGRKPKLINLFNWLKINNKIKIRA